jgi:hypothetical protein
MSVLPLSAALQLPIRSERSVISTTAPTALTQTSGSAIPVGASDFQIVAALKPFTDYIVLRILHRGVNANGTPTPTLPAYFRFLINPHTVQISHQTQDTQTMTRDGWKFGVWGEAFTQITLSGKTAGQYFTLGTTDMFREFTESYQNLLELQSVFDNNGYFFEGELTPSSSGQVAPTLGKRHIKMHQDVEIFCGEIIWSGLFDRLTVTQSADDPFLSDFNLSFTAWKERYRRDSPYWNMLPNNVQRGHTYNAYAALVGSVSTPQNLDTSFSDDISTELLQNVLSNGNLAVVGPNLFANSPAVTAALSAQTAPQVTPSQTYTPTMDQIDPNPGTDGGLINA